jgi:hypothetical protein
VTAIGLEEVFYLPLNSIYPPGRIRQQDVDWQVWNTLVATPAQSLRVDGRHIQDFLDQLIFTKFKHRRAIKTGKIKNCKNVELGCLHEAE